MLWIINVRFVAKTLLCTNQRFPFDIILPMMRASSRRIAINKREYATVGIKAVPKTNIIITTGVQRSRLYFRPKESQASPVLYSVTR